MQTRFFDDWKVGDILETITRTISEAEIGQFVTLCGFFEELFISEEFVSRHSLYPRRFAPGAMTFALAEGLIILSGFLHGAGLALLGVDDMRFERPLFPGDTIRVRVSVIDTRLTSNGERGVVTFAHAVVNQKDENVMQCRVKRMLRRRAESRS